MGWSESYYRDYLDQALRDWGDRISSFIKVADRFFTEISEAEASIHSPSDEMLECLRLWDEIKERLQKLKKQ